MNQQSLDPADAVPLLSGWIAEILNRRGTRYLLIKGPSLEFHGLRSGRVSSDVDLLVDPADVPAVMEVLQESGWRERPTTFAQNLYTEHSVSLLHPLWPIDIDVHHSFPGFFEPPAIVFDCLWRRRDVCPIADVACMVPDRASSVLILALHSLRGLTSSDRHRIELENLLEVLSRAPVRADDLLSLAYQTGCDASLKDFLLQLNIDVRPKLRHEEALKDWEERVSSPFRSSHMWRRLLAHSQGKQRIAVMRHLIWPSAHDLDLQHGGLVGGRGRYVRARLKRAANGLPVLVVMLKSWFALDPPGGQRLHRRHPRGVRASRSDSHPSYPRDPWG